MPRLLRLVCGMKTVGDPCSMGNVMFDMYHVSFSEDHVGVDNFQQMRSELIHILQRHDLECNQALLVLSEKKQNMLEQ